MKRTTLLSILFVGTAAIAGEQPAPSNTIEYKILAQPNSGMVRRPQIWNAQQLSERPFSLQGYVVELVGFRYYDQQEVAAGISKVNFYCGDKFVSAELSAEQIASINRSNRMFVTVKKQKSYSGIVPLIVVGTAYRHEGVSPDPIFYWKKNSSGAI